MFFFALKCRVKAKDEPVGRTCTAFPWRFRRFTAPIVCGVTAFAAASCAASSGNSAPKGSKSADSLTNASASQNQGAKTQPAAAAKPVIPANVNKPAADPNEHRCTVSISRGKVGGTNKPGIARIEMAASQDTSGAQLIRRTKENTTEYVEAGTEFGKDALPAGVYDLEFRRDDGTWCPLKIEVNQGDIDDAVILYLNIRFL